MSHGTSNPPPTTDLRPSSNSVPTIQIAARSNPKPSSKRAHPTFHFVAGLGSGISSAILLQPVDLLKTRVQQSRSSSLLPVLRSILAGPNPIYNLWRGTIPSALRTGFGSALYFTTLSTLRQIVANNAATSQNGARIVQKDGVLGINSSSVLPKLSATGNLVTGATARVLAGLVLMPMTIIKVRYESDYYAYKSLVSASSSIYKLEGIKGFFSGFGATAVRDAPYAGLYVVFYEGSKTHLSHLFTNPNNPDVATSKISATTINATSGVVAAAVATAATNPFDAVKTRVQLMPQKYQNLLRATRIMLKEDGVKSFFDGLGLRMGRKAVSSALVWTVYEELIGRAEKRLFYDEAAKSTATL